LVFKFKLPIFDSEISFSLTAIKLKMNTTQSPPSKKPLILIIDDDSAISALLKHLMEREGYTVKTILDGLEAKEYILSTNERPAFVLLEMMLPSVSGFDLLELIRDSATWADTPVIVLSSLSQENEIVRALKIGANDYVTKPFRVNELVARINRLS